MHSFKIDFMDSFLVKFKNLSLFKKYIKEDDIIEISIENKVVFLKVKFIAIGENFIPTFYFQTKTEDNLQIFGHTYSSGEICQNFAQIPIPQNNKNEIKKLAYKYYASISKLIISMSFRKGGANILFSSLPENDLSEYERVQLGSFYYLHHTITYENVDKLIENKVPIVLFSSNDPRISFKEFFIGKDELRKINIPANLIPKICHTIISKTKNSVNIVSENGVKFVANFLSLKIDVEPTRKDKVVILGLGSVGSFVFKNLLNDINVKSVDAIDPDVSSYKNTYRWAFGNVKPGILKAKIAEFEAKNNQSITLFDKNNNPLAKEVSTFPYVIGQRLGNKTINLVLPLLNKCDYIIDATGQDEVFKTIALLTKKPIYKVGLYDSGNVVVMSKSFNGIENANEIAEKWQDILNENHILPNSAYNTNDPANFLRTQLMSAIFYSYITNDTKRNGKEVQIVNGNSIYTQS